MIFYRAFVQGGDIAAAVAKRHQQSPNRPEPNVTPSRLQASPASPIARHVIKKQGLTPER